MAPRRPWEAKPLRLHPVWLWSKRLCRSQDCWARDVSAPVSSKWQEGEKTAEHPRETPGFLKCDPGVSNNKCRGLGGGVSWKVGKNLTECWRVYTCLMHLCCLWLCGIIHLSIFKSIVIHVSDNSLTLFFFHSLSGSLKSNPTPHWESWDPSAAQFWYQTNN